MSRVSIVLRSLFLLGFIVAMPLLALPSVARWLDDALYGKSESKSEPEDGNKSLDHSSADEKVAQATFDSPVVEPTRPARTEGKARGLDAVTERPPDLAAILDFPPTGASDDGASGGRRDPPLALQSRQSDLSSQAPERSGPPIRSDAKDEINPRIGAIRQRLEDLGADYLLLEAADATGQYHFHCRMLVAPGSTETETFEATGHEVVAVAQQVLKAVEAWRASQTSPPR
jgi:hypothetical protein